jgi:hypothetical protein
MMAREDAGVLKLRISLSFIPEGWQRLAGGSVMHLDAPVR